jgi:hypothetical protein
MFVSTEEQRPFERIERMHKIEITEVDVEGVIIPRPPKQERRFGGQGGFGKPRRPYRPG